MNVQTKPSYLHDPTGLPQRFETVRARTLALSAPLSAEDCCVQSMPDASPIKWHLAHTTWFFETFILERFEENFQPYHPAFRVLFNSYYNGIGDKHARAQRGLLTRPPYAEVVAYRHAVDARIMALLMQQLAADLYATFASLLELGMQHEQQHQELMLTDVLHLFSRNPLQPAYAETPPPVPAPAGALQWRSYSGGVVQIGHDDQAFCFDNELPVHRQFLEPYALATRLVTNREYLAFVLAGGYGNPSCWLSEGWDWVQNLQLTQPLYWQKNEDGASPAWHAFGLHGLHPLEPDAAVTQLSYFEADAYARWAGARLPTEAEWEHAALESLASGEAQADHMQFFGLCWQWTSSSYAAYPGYKTAAGALGEYNGKFMANQYVLRGSSCVTPHGHGRVTYRNFFPATARWQFSGIRLAR